MKVFTIEAEQGKYIVLETLMNHFPDSRYTAEKDNVAFVFDDVTVSFLNRTFYLKWDKITPPEKVAHNICTRAFAYRFKNIFIYTNEPKNSILVNGLISGFKAHLIPEDIRGTYAWGNVFVFCQPSC